MYVPMSYMVDTSVGSYMYVFSNVPMYSSSFHCVPQRTSAILFVCDVLQPSDVGLFIGVTRGKQRRASAPQAQMKKWPSFVATIPPRILTDTFYSSLKTLLFSRARVGSTSE